MTQQQQRKRRRGVILTREGLRRLEAAIGEAEIGDNNGERYTLESLSFRIGLDAKTIGKILERDRGIDKRSLQRCFNSFHLQLTESDYTSFCQQKRANDTIILTSTRVDWGEAVDISHFAGRTAELATLSRWIEKENCRAIAILGLGGIGKTSLSVQLARHLQSHFNSIIWRSLRNAPPLSELLTDLCQFFAIEPQTHLPLPPATQIRQFIEKLRSQRCLIILDNWETLLQSGAGNQRDLAEPYREGYENYGQLLGQLAETSHQSVILLTSREKPPELAALEGDSLPVRSFVLQGLSDRVAREIFKSKGLWGSDNEYDRLSQLYRGNPLALKIVATAIDDIFNGKIGLFLEQETLIFNGIRILLDEQFQRLSRLEREIVYWLAINREPVVLEELRSDLLSLVSTAKLLEALESLKRRSLIEFGTLDSSLNAVIKYTLQGVVMEYAIARFIDEVCEELAKNELKLFNTHSIIKAEAKNPIRFSQTQLILKPIVEELIATDGTTQQLVNRCDRLIESLRQNQPRQPGYAAGNLLNLLCYLNADLTGYNLSNLAIWQAYLQETTLPRVNFERCDLSKSTFAKTFSIPMSVAFSPDGRTLVTGDWDYNAYLWDIETGRQQAIYQGHQDKIWSVIFHPQGQILATGGDDCTIKLWDVQKLSGEPCLRTLKGHKGCIRSLVFSPSGQTLLSGSADGTIRLWDIQSGKCDRLFEGHGAQVWAVDVTSDFAIEGDEKKGVPYLLASASDDLTIKLWDIETGRCIRTLIGHKDWLRSLQFSPDGRILASGSVDRTIRLWDVATGECLRVLEGHTDITYRLVFIPSTSVFSDTRETSLPVPSDAREESPSIASDPKENIPLSASHSTKENGVKWTLISGSFDRTIRLWNLATGECEKVLSGHANFIYSLAVNGEGTLLASSSADQTVRLWSLARGTCIRTLQGRVNWISSVAFNNEGTLFVSGSEDRVVRIWTMGNPPSNPQTPQILRGHRDVIYSVALSPDGGIIASGSADCAVRLWDLESGQSVKLWNHQSSVMSVEFSPDGEFLATGSSDGEVRVWEVSTRRMVKTLFGHFVQTVAWSPDGKKLAIAAFDSIVSLWDIESEQCCQTFVGHTDWAWIVAISPDGETLATASIDGSIRLWDIATGNCLHSMAGHGGWIFALTFSLEGILASASSDCTIKLWDAKTGNCLQTLQGHTNWVMDVAFHPTARNFLLSSSGDTTIKLWDILTGRCLQTWKTERLYEGLKIAGAMGLTEAQKIALIALGAEG
ncbi:MAG: NB-ARC domain-containing protein [Cyanobacteriota bacterium]|nr:NB-ARC domain-containing protein [Cyanobacteriota bacterium]